MSKILEVEFVYLPLGLPEVDHAKNLSVLEDVIGSFWGKSGPPFELANGNKQFMRLKSICESARLVGSVSAVQAAAESFLPFQLESVAELEVAGSACAKILQSVGSNADVSKIFPGPFTTSNFVLCAVVLLLNWFVITVFQATFYRFQHKRRHFVPKYFDWVFS
ncbi:unnamed protein product [Hydatigera taeniaeformis]|uniref:UDP-glucuronosyl/UDP-glucosyltransferase n=1 Tax=Hydatigena taeniaeformis TaxID=6205 RepID=A0A0R3WUK0_HYDTA|nr:unnamed protein product [Hydatigera taeniaeformis]